MSGIIIRKVFSRATELRGDTVNLLEYYRDTIDNNRFVVYNGIKICDIEKDRCVAMLDMTENSENFNGVAHGGVLFTMGDVCAGMTARSDLRKYVTINADVHFSQAGKEGQPLDMCRYRRKPRPQDMPFEYRYNRRGGNTRLYGKIHVLLCIGVE